MFQLFVLLLLTPFENICGDETDLWKQKPVNFGQPVDVMTDVINNLGVKLLDSYADHPGNVAFSPTGLAFVLAALYEGTAGRTSREISHVLGLPRDRRITRIGLRDIHRRLRSYLNADAFLGGLTLNRDDIKLRPEYEEILRFYGFNVGENPAGNTTNGVANGDNNSTTMMTDAMAVNGSDPTMATIVSTTNMTDSLISTSSMDLTNPPTTSINPANNTTVPIDTTINPVAEIVTTNNSTVPGTMTGNIADMMIVSSSMSSSTVSMVTTTSSGTSMTGTINPTTPGSIDSNPNSRTDNDETTFMDSVPTVASLIDGDTGARLKSQYENNVRKKRSGEYQRSFNAYPAENIWLDDQSGWRGYIPPEQEYVPDGSSDQQTTELNFLVNGCEISTMSTATYTAVLPFAYIPTLHAFALEFPLDDPRYNVILMLPSERLDNRNMVRLLHGKTLRRIRETLRPTWVIATIPSFMLRGFITLTPYLQKLGIRDAFEPRAADLSPMSPDLGVYARDVQQSIGVNIRNYMRENRNDSSPSTSSTRSPYPHPENLLHNREPIPFIVSRPFLFFIVDVETSVALMAGRIDDPLNSRIV